MCAMECMIGAVQKHAQAVVDGLMAWTRQLVVVKGRHTSILGA
jgi:hypothetical protein